MNKKFSTLVASLLLASAVGTVSAAAMPDFVKSVQPETAGNFKAGTYYQLASASGQEVLTMEKVDNRFILKLIPYEKADLANSLWVIEPSTNSDSEGGLSFRFKNKRYGLYISYNAKDAALTTGATSYLPGNVAVWKWSEALEGKKFVDGAALKAAFGEKKDSVIYLNQLSDGTLAAMKTATKNSYTSVTLTPKTAGWVLLGADDLNTMLGMQNSGKLKMNFNPETTGENLFTKNEYRVVPAAGANSYSLSAQAAYKQMVEDGEKELAYLKDKYAGYDVELRKYSIKSAEAQKVALGYNLYQIEGQIAKEKAENVELTTAAGEAVQDFYNQLGSEWAQSGEFKDASEAADEANKKYMDAYEQKTYWLEALAALRNSQITNAKDALSTLKTDFSAAKENFKTVEFGLSQAIGYAKGIVADANKYADEAKLEKLDLAAELEAVEGAKDVYTTVIHKNGWSAPYTEDEYKELLAGELGDVLKDMFTKRGSDYFILFKANENTKDKFTSAFSTFVNEQITSINGKLANAELTNGGIMNKFAYQIAALSLEVKGLITRVEGYSEAGKKFLSLETSINALNKALELTTDDNLTAAQIEKFIETCDYWVAEYAKALENVKAILADAQGSLDLTIAGNLEAFNKVTAAYSNLIKNEKAIQTSISTYGDGRVAWADYEKFYSLWAIYAKQDFAIRNVEWTISFGNHLLVYWNAEVSEWVSLEASKDKYLMVDTAYMTQSAGDQYQSFANSKTFKSILGETDAIRDINGRINFRFLYSASNDSLLIESEGGALKKVTTDYWTNMTDAEVAQGDFGNLVMVKVLGNTREVTIQQYEIIKGVHNKETINTRIGFASAKTQGIKQIPSGVYLIKKVTTDPALNGKYAVDNFLSAFGFGFTEKKNQNFQHIPAAQWVVVADANATTNSIYNRESADPLLSGFEGIQFYTDASGSLFTMAGDTLALEAVADVTTPELGYNALADITNVPDANYTTYAFNLIDGLATGLSINADNRGNLKVAKDATYFTVIPRDTVEYGKDLKDVAVKLKRVAYSISDGNGKFIAQNADGKYVLTATTLAKAPQFYMKEFKMNADSVCHYALINTNLLDKVGVDYTSTLLVNEDLEDGTIGFTSENTATFALAKNEIARYRKVAAEPAYKQFFQADNEESIILCENPENKGAGTSANPSKPTGLNYLGQANKDFSIYVDTAYVRGDTKRPQYLLGLRPDFTPMVVPCPEGDNSHPATEVAQTKAEYLVALTDSIAKNPTKKEKFQSKEKETRLAFVPATHRNDSLIMSDGARIDLSKNAYNNATFQLLYAEPGTETEDFYIEVGQQSWLKILNAVPVIVSNKDQADVFNVVKSDDPTANEDLTVSEVSVIGGDGNVTIAGADGKKVVISNLLGQIIANTVLTSDNATIAVPAGIVVVAVEGEEAVKAIVK